MKTSLTSSLICFFFLVTTILPQSILDRAEYAKKLIDQNKSVNQLPAKNFTSVNDEWDVIGYTDYDYIGNGGVPQLLSLYDIDNDGKLDPVGVYNQRASVSGSGIRRASMFIGLGGEFANFYLIDTTLNSGWPTIKAMTIGPWSGHSAVMFQQGNKSYLSLVEMSTFFQEREELDFYSPSSSFCYLDDGTIFAIDSEGKLRKLLTDNLTQSTETGIQFHQSAASQPIKSSFNGEYLAVLAFTENDEVLLYFSDDRGENWSVEVIGQNFVTEVENRVGVFPLFTNFAQASYVVDNEGTVHIGMNGYGILVEDDDTSFTYPALYWNSKNRDWIAVSDPAEEGEELTDLYPGNGIGNAYPTPVITEDGRYVSVLYQSPEFENGLAKKYQGDGLANNYECYYTDISIVNSNDGGVTFFAPEPIISEPEVSEVFPSSFDLLFYETAQPPQIWTSFSWYFIFMIDEIPGCSIFGENSPSENTSWNYVRYGVATTNVDVDEKVPTNFALFQNYPNPFNPTTSIEYQVASSDMVSLKVYDVLGREVKTLVNEQKSPGSYNVTFDARNLSSGIYFYSLRSGSFTQTRKMILLR